ncbi:MAG: ATP-binding cassette domain-containing protein [Lachnospiraceae bacterium]|nr:ATP-binding cassette domain-containing protein [Lachnospiraceae bacterium]
MFNATDIYSFFSYLICYIGYAYIFKKLGKKMWKAFIPIYNTYELAKGAKRELDGRIQVVLNCIMAISDLVIRFLPESSLVYYIISLFRGTVAICVIVYQARICSGLCEVFGKNKYWVVIWLLFEGLTSLYWGLSKKIQPVITLEEENAADVSGVHVEEIEEGLTINIRERTAMEFFKKKVLLKDLHLTIPKGHLVLLLGGSGAGKTTFLNAVTGYEKADATVLLNGHDLYKEYESMKYDVGFVPQQDLMRPNDTVLMTLEDAAKLRLPGNIDKKERKKRVQEVLEGFGLSMLANNLVEKLSGGQRKRLSIAMEFISDPSLFILDEPDSGLDGVVARGLFEKLRAIADSGKIVIVITHTPDRVADLFDDVIVLAKDVDRTGRLAYYGSLEDARKFFKKDSMEHVLLAVNQKEEGGEGRANEFVKRYTKQMKKAG